MDYLKCNCLHCSCGIEFPTSAVGETVECPHCGKQTMLHAVASNVAKKKSLLTLGIAGAMVVLCATTVVLWKFLGSRSLKPRSATTSLTSAHGESETTAQAGKSQKLPSDLQELKLQAEKGDSESQYQIGKHYFDATNYSEARKWFQLAAEQNNPGGQNSLGIIYLYGRGMPIDYRQALNWFTKAAEQGFAKAEFYLGEMYHEENGVAKDEVEGTRWYRKAAEQDLTIAVYNLGVVYYEGTGLAKDEVEGARWFRRAAEQGDPWAQHNLGIVFSNGRGLPKNNVQAAKWSLRAAEQGLSNAQYVVGRQFEYGIGVQQDWVEAHKWYSLAASQNFKPALESRNSLERKMTAEQIKEAKQRTSAFVKSQPIVEPATESREEMVFDDPAKFFRIKGHRILVGQRAVDEGLIYDHALQAAHQQKKEIIYFEVSVSNMGARQEAHLSHNNFILEDTEGNSYSAEQTIDYLYGNVHLGKTGSGGVAFSLYKGSVPKKMIFDTGMVWQEPKYSTSVGLYYSNGDKIFAFADDLDELEIFSGKRLDFKGMVAKAKQGDVAAQRFLGLMYAKGRGVPKSDSEAMNWFRKAAEQGDAPSQYILGLSCDAAMGVPQDYAEAFKWISLAANQNHKDAGRRREDLRSRMTREQLVESAHRISLFTNSVTK